MTQGNKGQTARQTAQGTNAPWVRWNDRRPEKDMRIIAILNDNGFCHIAHIGHIFPEVLELQFKDSLDGIYWLPLPVGDNPMTPAKQSGHSERI